MPPYVQRVGPKAGPWKYRGWWIVGTKRRFGRLRKTPQQAHTDAMHARQLIEPPTFGGTFEARAKEWLAAVAATRAEDTVEFYRGKLASIYQSIPGAIQLARINAAALRTFITEARCRGLGARTIQHCRRTLHRLFTWCQRRGYAQDNPVPNVDWPRPEDHRPDVFTELELAGVLLKVNDQFARDLAVFLAYTGLRRAELARLQIADVDAQACVLWVRGKARSQSHPMPPEAAAAAERLAAGANGSTLVDGATERGRRERIAETFRTWQRKLKEPRFHPHALRHSVATIMLRQGAAPGTVQRFLRHASYAMTQRYVHMVEDDVRGATARLRIVGGEGEAAKHG
jgi:site-specific recombinase XerD